MSGVRFSINFPTRGRIPFVVKLLTSIYMTVDNIDNIEINIGYDNDDIYFIGAIKYLNDIFKNVNINYYGQDRDENLTKFHNYLASKSTGEYIIAVCDDCEFKTNNWESTAYDKLSKCDKPVFGNTWDGRNDPNSHTSFPLVSRDMFDKCGYIFDDRCYVWGADIRLWMLFSKLEMIIDLPELFIEHNSYHTGKREIDDVGKYIQDINSRHPNTDDDKWINETIEKLNVTATRQPYLE